MFHLECHRVTSGLVVVIALAGAWACGLLTAAHGGGWQTDAAAAGPGPCATAVAPSARCAEVIDSRWGSFDVTLGGRRILVPTALLGLAYFGAAATWFGLAGAPPATARKTWLALLIISGSATAASIFLLVQMATAAHAWCPLCIVGHGLSAALFAALLAVRLTSAQIAPAPVAPPRDAIPPRTAARPPRPWLGWTVSVMTVGGVWLYYDAAATAKHYFHESTSARAALAGVQGDRDLMLRAYESTAPVTIPARTAAPAEGRARLVVFSDPTCRACACFEVLVDRVIEPLFGQALIVERRQCVLDGAGAEAASGEPIRRLARAVEAARRQGGDTAFLQMAGVLRRHRHDRAVPDYAELSRRIGLDGERLVADMDSEAVAGALADDEAVARTLGVTRLPAVFLDGRAVPEVCVSSRVFWEAAAARQREHCDALALDLSGKGPGS